MKPPKIGDKLVPVITDGELSALLATCKGSGFQNRRDYAVISLFKDTGIRLSELAGLRSPSDVSAQTGRRSSPARATSSAPSSSPTTPPARLTATCASAPSTRWRAASALWLGVRGGPMTASGIYQMIERRASQGGRRGQPAQVPAHFSHVWLDRGGAEGDLMELNGWSSPQMLARYGRSARSARARRHYDDIMELTWPCMTLWQLPRHRYLQGNQVVNRRRRDRRGRGRGGGVLRARLRPGPRARRDRVDGPSHPVDRGWPDLGQFDGHARLGPPGRCPCPSLARWLLGLGIAATLAANVAHGLGHGPIGAAVAAWPAVALVGSYELLMMIIRGTQQPAGDAAPDTASGGHAGSGPVAGTGG